MVFNKILRLKTKKIQPGWENNEYLYNIMILNNEKLNLDNFYKYKEAIELEKEAKVLKNKGLADDLQEGVELEWININYL